MYSDISYRNKGLTCPRCGSKNVILYTKLPKVERRILCGECKYDGAPRKRQKSRDKLGVEK